MRLRQNPRVAASIVEGAIVYPVILTIILMLLVGSMGIFRYQELATLSREAARYASTHGTQYAHDANVSAPTPADIYNTAIVGSNVALDLSQLSYSITYNTNNQPYHTTVDSNGNIQKVQNTVTVSLTYQWIPELYLGGVTMSSTSVLPMSN